MRDDEKTTALVPYYDDDGWATEAAVADGRMMKGTLIRFADWKWTQGSECAEIEKGRQIVAVGLRSAWVFWKDRKPAKYVTPTPGHGLPDRFSLGDNDQDAGELDAKGEPKDPWANTRYVYLLDPKTAEEATSPPSKNYFGCPASCGASFL